jgi:hypothetical protein
MSSSETSVVLATCAAPPIDVGRAVADLLAKQASIAVSIEARPLLPWTTVETDVLKRRLERIRRTAKTGIVADAAGSYLPHLPQILEGDPRTRVVHLTVAEEEAARAFGRLFDHGYALPVNHWVSEPAMQWQHDPDRTRCYPKYDLADRLDCVRRYRDEYEETVEGLRQRFPDRILVTTPLKLSTEEGVRAVLEFVGVARESQVLQKYDGRSFATLKVHPRATVRGTNLMDPERCLILVPFSTHIGWETECLLRKLEERGYPVRRYAGVSAIDQARNQLASDAMVDGFDETLWIDSDMGFNPDDVERIRAHGEPIVAGLYAKKGVKGFAAAFLPGTEKVTMGTEGGLTEILYAGTGFLHVRREVYWAMQNRLKLPVCNELFPGRPIIPFFQPMTVPHEDSLWYLGEDYSFSHRARECGYRILTDTCLRLWHIGQYRYGWEDVATGLTRCETFRFDFDV